MAVIQEHFFILHVIRLTNTSLVTTSHVILFHVAQNSSELAILKPAFHHSQFLVLTTVLLRLRTRFTVHRCLKSPVNAFRNRLKRETQSLKCLTVLLYSGDAMRCGTVTFVA